MSSENSPSNRVEPKEPDDISLVMPSEFRNALEAQDTTRVTSNRLEAMKTPPPVATITGDIIRHEANDANGSGDPQAAPDDEFLKAAKEHIGTIVAGRYRILDLLGVGGMGSVFKAEHIMLGSFVAVKILNSDLTSNSTAIKRFSQEAKAANSLQHPNIAAVSDFGLTESGLPYFVMDLVDGTSLSTLIDDNGFVDWKRAVEFGIQIADAMAYAHLKGIVHRDLKPGNIIISKTVKGEEHATVVDFGIAKLNDDSIGAQKLTRTGEVFGSPLYMSPEQCTGNTMDSRSDIYSFGCMMYEVLTGEMPFCGENAVQTILMQINEPAPSFKSHADQKITSSIPNGFETVIMHCLEKDPAHRYSSMEDVKADLLLVKRGQPPTRKSKRRFHIKFKAPGILQTGFVVALGTVAIFIGMALWINKLQYDLIPWQRDFSAAKHEMERGEFDQAVLSARHGIKVGNDHKAAKQELAGLYNALGDAYKGLGTPASLNDAKQAYEKAITLCVNAKSAKHKVLSYQSLGDINFNQGNSQAALSNYDSSLASFSDKYEDDAQKARLYLRKAKVYEQDKKFADAKKNLTESIRIYRSLDAVHTPALCDALEKLAFVSKATGDNDQATNLSNEAKKLRDSF